MKRLSLNTSDHTQFVDMTRLVQQEVSKAGLEDGIVTIFIPHTTAGVMIQENADPDVQHDLKYLFEKMMPWKDEAYDHAEGNTAAHMKAACVGSSAHVIVESGQLQLGTWQGIYFCEFDGPRSRQVWVKFSK
ncbi:MAG: secondary thiamine-phosphate synthase enzyme YjbQ [Verrucomicrobiota bacterium]|nr:secondary thiamine-phosphate synthase enzyme YjbQ [Verrucomicrobiota bacterium]